MVIVVADLSLIASLSRSHEGFLEGLNFCLNAPSYAKLMSTMEHESSITNANVVLDILKENRDTYKSQQQTIGD